MCGCCCCSKKEKGKKEYECAVAPKKCPTKIVDENQVVPICCGKPMKPRK